MTRAPRPACCCWRTVPRTSSPAEQRIAAAETRIATRSRHAPTATTTLALALARRARETADPAFYERAEEALAEVASPPAPDNYEGRKVARLGPPRPAPTSPRRCDEAQRAQQAGARRRARLRLPGRRARRARATTTRPRRRVQWMLDLRPGNVPGLTRAAYLRELFGDLEGAIELMDEGVQRTPPAEREDRAWIADADRAPPAGAGTARRRRRSSSPSVRWSSSPATTTRSRSSRPCAPRSAGSTRRLALLRSATTRPRRIPRTSIDSAVALAQAGRARGGARGLRRASSTRRRRREPRRRQRQPRAGRLLRRPRAARRARRCASRSWRSRAGGRAHPGRATPGRCRPMAAIGRRAPRSTARSRSACGTPRCFTTPASSRTGAATVLRRGVTSKPRSRSIRARRLRPSCGARLPPQPPPRRDR